MGKAIENTIAVASGVFLPPAILWATMSPAAALWPAMNWSVLLPLVSLIVVAGISTSGTAARRMCRVLVLLLLGLLVASFTILFLMV